MLPARTAIGLAAGSAIIAIGAAALALHLGDVVIEEDHAVPQGGSVGYSIPAPAGTQQLMRVEGDSFEVTLASPGGLQLDGAGYEGSADLEWAHAADGETRIRIQNTGPSELAVTGTLVRSADPIWFTYDLMVVISGMVIIGFSMGFARRRPRGF